MSTGTKRLAVELKNLLKREEKAIAEGLKRDFRVWLVDENIKHWRAKIMGPDDTTFANGIYLIDIKFPDKYPYSPPQMRFVTKMYHPNISSGDGGICLDILKNGKWSAALRVEKVLMSIISFLADPNPDDPLSSGAASLYRSDKAKYDKTIVEYKEKYCCKSWETNDKDESRDE